MQPNISLLERAERARLNLGVHDGSCYLNGLHCISMCYPYPWTVKVTSAHADNLRIHFLRYKTGGAPFMELAAGPISPDRVKLTQLQQYARKFVRENGLHLLNEYEGTLGVDRIAYYGFEYIQENANDLITRQISFVNQNIGREYQVLCCYREENFDEFFNTHLFDKALESIRFIPGEETTKNLPPVFYFDGKPVFSFDGIGGTYFCSACGVRMEHLDVTCPNCFAKREGVWCQACGFMNPVDLFITNRHYCGSCGQLVDIRFSAHDGCSPMMVLIMAFIISVLIMVL